MVLSLSASCNTANTDATSASETTKAGTSQENVTESVTEKEFPHQTEDFGGYTFRILADHQGDNELYYEDLEAESPPGEVYGDALYARKIEIEDKFNVKFVTVNHTDYSALLKKSVNTGSDEYDLFLPRLNSAYNMIPYALDLNSLQNLSFGESWWDNNSVADLSIANKLYMVTGDVFTKHYDGIQLLLFNKELLADYTLENPYLLVKSGKWTLDKMGEMSKSVNKDLNSDGKMDRYDQWGLAFQLDNASGILNGAGLKFLYKDENDIPYTMPNTERMNSAIDKFLSFYNDYTWDCLRDGGGEYMSAFFLFPNGNSLFFSAMPRYITWQLRDMEHDYGILPNPKLDENQEEYYNLLNNFHTFSIMMPKTVADPEKAAYILDAMGFYGEKIIKPAYYDVCLSRKYTRDDESSEMLDIIFNSTVYDLGFYANFGNVYSSVQNIIANGRNTYSSAYEKTEAKIQNAIDSFLAGIEE
ncbi:hypothetical protein FACS1894105_07500 [Clostridia bacterium]|nr:hypothetical protein FACS1894105_07500 [Clostridia bacterium]